MTAYLGHGVAPKERIEGSRGRWRAMTLYEKFEHAIILILVGLIALVVVAAVWSLLLKIVYSLVLLHTFDPTDPAVFQAVFGMIFTVIIALEFKRTLLVAAERKHSIVQVRAVILIAMLAIIRKLIILDLATTGAPELLALAVAILSLGAVYWLVRGQDRELLELDRDRPANDTTPRELERGPELDTEGPR